MARRFVTTGRGGIVLGRIEVERHGEKVTKIIRDDSGIFALGYYLKLVINFNAFAAGPDSQVLWAKNAFDEPANLPMVRTAQVKVDANKPPDSHVIMEFILQIDENGRTGPAFMDPYGMVNIYSESE